MIESSLVFSLRFFIKVVRRTWPDACIQIQEYTKGGAYHIQAVYIIYFIYQLYVLNPGPNI